MHRLRLNKPSPSMAVAVTALMVALGGTALAGPIAQIAKKKSGDSIIKKHSLSGNRLKNNTITGTQVNAATLGKVGSARVADTATSAGSAKPRAYGLINSTGMLDTTRSSGIAAAELASSPSDYCVTPSASTGINVATEFPVVSADYNQGPGITKVAEIDTAGACTTSAGPGWVIKTWRPVGGSVTFSPTAFSLIAP